MRKYKRGKSLTLLRLYQSRGKTKSNDFCKVLLKREMLSLKLRKYEKIYKRLKLQSNSLLTMFRTPLCSMNLLKSITN